MEREAYPVFAEVLEYPVTVPAASVETLVSLLPASETEAGRWLGEFRDFALGAGLERLQELYTTTFDLQPVCSPYVGYHLFGEEHRRGLFMARLKEEYRKAGFECGSELPDHLCVVLRYLAEREPGDFERDLVNDGLIPALEKMVGEGEGENPYQGVLRALRAMVGAAAS